MCFPTNHTFEIIQNHELIKYFPMRSGWFALKENEAVLNCKD